MKENHKRLFKKLGLTISKFYLTLTNVSTIGTESQVTHSQEGHVNILDIIEHPDKYPDIDVTLHESASDFVSVIHDDHNLSLLDKVRIVNEVHTDQLKVSTYAYLTLFSIENNL